MTEAEWLACKSCDRALLFLRKRVSNRKLRLFACACCRLVGDLLTGEAAWRALAVAEDYADGRALRGDLRAGRREAAPATINFSNMAGHVAHIAVVRATHEMAWQAARQAASVAAEADSYREPRRPGGIADAASVYQRELALLREIFNPFRAPAEDARPAPSVRGLAAAAYEEQALPSGHLDTNRLGVLADALEEAGCADADLLGHLRAPRPHVRGCWALDLVLGKE